MSDIVHLILISLSSFSITWIIRFTNGPFDIFARFRRRIGVDILVPVGGGELVYVESDIPPRSFIGKLVYCYWCLTTWVSLLVCVVYIISVRVDIEIAGFLWLSAIAISGFLYELLED